MAPPAGNGRATPYLLGGRLGIAVLRGLLLDLLATGDREGVDAALEAWIALNARLDRSST